MAQITIVEKKGKSCPMFKCEHCGKIIEDASDANLCWDYDTPSTTAVICKSAVCERQQERRLGGACWMDLDVALIYILKNSKVDRVTAEQRAATLSLT